MVQSELYGIRMLFSDDGKQVLYVARDIATALGYGDIKHAIAYHCKDAPSYESVLTTGGSQRLRVLSKADTLRLILGSNYKNSAILDAVINQVADLHSVLEAIYELDSI